MAFTALDWLVWKGLWVLIAVVVAAVAGLAVDRFGSRDTDDFRMPQEHV